MKIHILRFDSIDSTNNSALDQARDGAEEGLCVVARQQTAGRGRHGRTWVSPQDSGLYFSIILRPVLEVKFLPLVTLMAGVAVHDTLRELGLNADIKWVNDVLVNEKKMAGILAETAETKTGLAVVVGIGMNMRMSSFPPKIAETATSIEAEASRTLPFSELEETLARNLVQFYETLQASNGRAEILKEWQRRSSYFSGKEVVVQLENKTITGTTDGLELDGALRVKDASGKVNIIHAGDVERLRSQRRP